MGGRRRPAVPARGRHRRGRDPVRVARRPEPELDKGRRRRTRAHAQGDVARDLGRRDAPARGTHDLGEARHVPPRVATRGTGWRPDKGRGAWTVRSILSPLPLLTADSLATRTDRCRRVGVSASRRGRIAGPVRVHLLRPNGRRMGRRRRSGVCSLPNCLQRDRTAC